MFNLTKYILEDYFYGRCSKKQSVFVREWISDHANEEEATLLMQEIYDGLNVRDPLMAEKAFNEVCTQLGLNSRNKKRSRLQAMLKITRTIAAVCAIPLVLLSMLLWQKSKVTTEWIEIYVPYGEMKNLVLPDSTVLWLNSGSRVTYPEKFRGGKRQIFAQGEMYADVRPDAGKPFIIQAGDFSVEVLGTCFNMKAYPEDAAVELILVEGSIRCETVSEDHPQKMMLKAGDIAYYNRDTDILEKRNFNPTTYSSFYEGGGLTFFHQPLSDITSHLERCFNRKIVILDKKLGRVEYFAFFTKDDTLEKILETINMDKAMLITENNGIIFVDSRNKR